MYIIISVCGIFIVLVIIIAVRTSFFKPPKISSQGKYVDSVDMEGAKKLAEAIKIPTISYIYNEKIDWTAFEKFRSMLKTQFPLVNKYCEVTLINERSLVYRLKSESPTNKPVLITAHMDVVPVEEGTDKDWTEPPFGGVIKDGYIWGRGTLDIKIHLITAMEALERLLRKGFKPGRDIYMAFGHDEEVSGRQGALKIAEYFKNQGLEFDFVIDEGGCVIHNIIPGISSPLALIGVGEKGYANIMLSVTKDGGHSSMPSQHTSLGILAEALYKVEKHPFKPRLTPPVKEFLMRIGPHMELLNRVILANLWLFKPLFLRVFSKINSGSALLRTTMAVTMAQGSPAPNVVPQNSSAVVNCRILPGGSAEILLNHFKRVLKGMPVEIKPVNLDNPSELSPSDSEAFRYIERLVNEFCPGAIVAPYLVMAGTDARKYECVSKNIYRFTPYIIDNSDFSRIHGTNERISVVNVNRCIDFFTALMERLV